MNKRRIITGLLTMVVAAGVVLAGTTAYFSDTETSEGNRFQAGALDLKIDSEAHYNGLVCRLDDENGTYRWLEPVGSNDPDLLLQEHYGVECFSTWPEDDLTFHQFFNFLDLKPGDFGENTISLHVYDNDAWGRFRVHNLVSADNDCTEPESEVDNCNVGDASDPANGELHEYLRFSAWLDQGAIPGFQCVDGEGVGNGPCENDPYEGDNIYQASFDDSNFPNAIGEPQFWDNEAPAEGTWNLADVLGPAYTQYCTGTGAPDPAPAVNGHNDYGPCHGLAEDGRMVGSTTYYFGLAWSLPFDTGNIVQTDSLTADMSFDIVQWRNNPSPAF